MTSITIERSGGALKSNATTAPHSDVLRIVSPRLSADLYCDGALPANDIVMSRVAHWRGQGYVPEDACVLALMYPNESPLAIPLTTSKTTPDAISPVQFPRLRDHTSGLRNTEPFPALMDPTPGIYPIVDQLSDLEALMAAGARIIQLRIKSDRLTPDIERTIHQAVALCQHHPKCQLFINDYWQTAIAAGAYGVHLGQEDLLTADLQALQTAGVRLGVSSHAFWEVARAITVAPSYVACGPLFPTRAKKMPWMAQGIDNLRYWVRVIPYPVIGIGGVNDGNLREIHDTGCASASIIAAIVSAANPAKEFQRLQQLWTNYSTGASTTNDTVGPSSRIGRIAKPTLSALL